PRDAGVGPRNRLLARPRGGLLRSPRHARTRLLVPARAAVSLRRCRSRSVPIGPAGAATQAGAGTVALAASGIGTSQALAAAVSIGALGVFSGAAVLLFALAWRTGRLLLPARTAT